MNKMHDNDNRDVVITIPAYEPDGRMLDLLSELISYNYRSIIVVDDGSGDDYSHLFESAEKEYGCDVIHHETNKGYGGALKTGASRFCELYGSDDSICGFIQCDCDGQHSPHDIARFARALRDNPNTFITGTRQFDKGVPWKSRLGNKITRRVFNLMIGVGIEDTQCGLRGIPRSLAHTAADIKGDHMEYTISFLIEISRRNAAYMELPIETIYIENNGSTHFDTFRDSVRIYSMLLKYTLSSVSAFLIDIAAFSILFPLLRPLLPSMYIPAATYIARVISCTYTYFVNKKLVFASADQDKPGSALRFALLAVLLATCSGFITRGVVNLTGLHETFIKIVTDTVLFIVSFRVQHRWVFAKETDGES